MKMLHERLMVGLVALSGLSLGSSGSAAESKSVEDRLQELEGEILVLKIEVEGLKSSKQTAHSFGIFDPLESSFQVLRTDTGTLAVAIKNVEGFADASRLTIEFGNLTSATLSDVQLDFTYGPRMPKPLNFGSGELGAWTDSLKKHSLSLTKDLKPGNWNPIQVVLPGIKPSDLGYVRIDIDNSAIMLGR